MWDQTTLKPVAGDDELVTRAAHALDNRPARWRGSLIVGVTDGRPLALAHLPRRSIWPFVVSIGFLLLFTAALLEFTWIALTGLAVTAVGLGGWFWPVDTETTAIEEAYVDEATAPGSHTDATPAPPHPMGYRGGAPGLPLAVGDRAANGYWGTSVLVAILCTALATIVASYFYLGTGASPVPAGREPPPWPLAIAATVVALLALAATRWLTVSVDRRATGGRRLALLAAFALWTAFAVLGVLALHDAEIRPSENAYHSMLLALVGFSVLLAIGIVGMLVAAQAWAWRAPDDPRGRGVALNTSLVSYAGAGTWAVVFAVAWLWPRLA